MNELRREKTDLSMAFVVGEMTGIFCFMYDMRVGFLDVGRISEFRKL
jgi:hypothetical protein